MHRPPSIPAQNTTRSPVAPTPPTALRARLATATSATLGWAARLAARLEDARAARVTPGLR